MSANGAWTPHPALMAEFLRRVPTPEAWNNELIAQEMRLAMFQSAQPDCSVVRQVCKEILHSHHAIIGKTVMPAELTTESAAEPDYTLSQTWRLIDAVLSLSQRAQGALLDQHGYRAIVTAMADLTALADKANAELRKLGLE